MYIYICTYIYIYIYIYILRATPSAAGPQVEEHFDLSTSIGLVSVVVL